MSLTQEQQRQNEREFQKIQENLFLIYGYSEELRKKLSQLLELTYEVLNEEEILCSIPKGKELFQDLLDKALFEKFDQADFLEKVKAKAIAYKALEAKSSEDNRQIFAAHQSYGILSSLTNSNASAELTEGNERDISVLLKAVTTYPDQVTTHGTYILPSVAISPGLYTSEEETNQPTQFIKDHIETVRDNNSDQEQPINLLTVVGAGQSHWYIASVELIKGEITNATLYDPKKRQELASSDPDLQDKQDSVENTIAFQNFKEAVTELNHEFQREQGGHEVVVNAIPLGVQDDSFRCMDYCAQHVLRLLPSEQVEDAALDKIRDATTGEELRTAVISTIIKNYPALHTNDEEVEHEIDQVFNPAVEVKKDFHDTFKVYSGQESETAKKAKNVQILFDALLAQRLAELYKEKPEGDEQALWEEASRYTFEVFQKRYGFFKPAQESQVSNNLDPDSLEVKNKI